MSASYQMSRHVQQHWDDPTPRLAHFFSNLQLASGWHSGGRSGAERRSSYQNALVVLSNYDEDEPRKSPVIGSDKSSGDDLIFSGAVRASLAPLVSEATA